MMRYEHALRSARNAAKSTRPAIGLLFSATLLMAVMACAGNAGEQQPSHDTAAAANGGGHDTTKTATSLAPKAAITSATDDLASDTIPLRAPDGGIARFGIASAHITQVYGGARRGFRDIMFDHYGMREYTLDSSAPYPDGAQGPFQNSILISTPEMFGRVDRVTHDGAKRPNLADDNYLKSDSSKRFSLGDLVFMAAVNAGKRLPDTVINGFHCRVVEISQPGFTDTRYFWRGIMMMDRFTPMDGKWFTIETTSITPNVTVPDSYFEFPAGYKIQTLSADQPLERPMPPGTMQQNNGMQRGMPTPPMPPMPSGN